MTNEKRRLIAADLLIAYFSLGEEMKSMAESIHDARFVKALQDAPTVDAVLVTHGRWKYYHKKNIAVCTNCSFERDLDANFGKAVSCPNCGAKMDGGNENVE